MKSKRKDRRGHWPKGKPRNATAINWESQRELLEKLTDVEVARRLRCTRERVRQVRKRFGIPPSPRGRKARRWTESEIGLLGKFADKEVAKQLAIAAATVAEKRQALGILPWKGSVSKNPIIRLPADLIAMIDDLRNVKESRSECLGRILADLKSGNSLREMLSPIIKRRGIRTAATTAGIRPNTLADWIAGRGRDGRKYPQRLSDEQVDSLCSAVGVQLLLIHEEGKGD